jgi:beta-lactamase regulating signal transducer with metallopeptidase domain
MASEWLETLLRLNLAAAAAIAAVMFVRKGVRRLAGARAAYALWLTVPAAAAGSFLPARTLKVTLPGVTQIAPAGETLAPLPPAAPEAVPIDWTGVFLAVWAAGALMGLVWLTWRHWRFVATVCHRGPGGRLQALANGVGPAVVGVVAPRILLPRDFSERFSPRERAVVLAHERFHLEQGHAQTNALALLTLCLNWFNPALHLAVRAVRLDQELACDEAVIRQYPNARRSYAEAMLKTQLSPAPMPLGCYWPARGSALRQRLAMLHAPSPTPLRVAAGAAAASTLAVLAAVGAWAAQPATVIYAAASEATAIPRALEPQPQARIAPVSAETPAAAVSVVTPAEPDGVAPGASEALPAAEEPDVLPPAPAVNARMAAELREARAELVEEVEQARRAYEQVRARTGSRQTQHLIEAEEDIDIAREALGLFDAELQRGGIEPAGNQSWSMDAIEFRAILSRARAVTARPYQTARQPQRDPAVLEKDARVWIETKVELPNGRTIGGQAMFDQPGTTGAQDGYYIGDRRYSIASSITQQGDRVQVRPKVFRDNRLVGKGSAWIESGKTGIITLDNGQVVSARVGVVSKNGMTVGVAFQRGPRD